MSYVDDTTLPTAGHAYRVQQITLLGCLMLADGAAVLSPILLLGRPFTVFEFIYAATCFLALGTYRGNPRLRPHLTTDLSFLLGRLGAVTLFAGVLAVLMDQQSALIGIASTTTALVLSFRTLAYKLMRDARARGLIKESVLIVGAGQEGTRLAHILMAHTEFGLVPVGFVDTIEDDTVPVPIVGDLSDLDQLVRLYSVQRVIIAFGAARDADIVRILRACERLSVNTYVIPRFFELGAAAPGPSTDEVWGIPLIRLVRPASGPYGQRAKRILDLVLVAALLAATWPVFAVGGLLVRCSGPGPIFFRQKRVGKDGRVFELLKLRTMPVNEDSDTTWSVDADERVTAIGRFLRRTCWDELPQIFNVIKGDMSLVGPRPERPHFVDQFRLTVRSYEDRHRVPAGLTGWAQIHALRGDTSVEERVVFDNLYIEHWSLWQDLLILARTPGAVMHGGPD